MLVLTTSAAGAVELPTGGVVAHRGASATHPENTLAAFREAIWLGAQQIEFDVARTSDGVLVLMHDDTVDRTTTGAGSVGSLTLAEIKQLDAGSWKGLRFTGERVPTLAEALDIMPENVWLNVHMKGGYAESYSATMMIFQKNREHQAFMAVTAAQAAGARQAAIDAGKTIMLCNMEGQRIGSQYVTETIEGGFQFLQFSDSSGGLPLAADVQRLHDAGVKANYYGSSYLSGTLSATKQTFARTLLTAGIDFPLVDDSVLGTCVAEDFGHMPVRPAFRGNVHPASLGTNVIVNPGAEIWMNDYHNQTTAALPAADPLLTRDRELFGWNDVVEATNEPYGAANVPSAAAFPVGTFGKNAFVGGRITGTRWIEQTIDLEAIATVIDQGSVAYTLSAWLGGLAGQRDFTALSASFKNADGDELATARVHTLNPSDWGETTGMVFKSDSGLVPVGSRSIEVRLSFNGQGGAMCNGLADNLSLVLATGGAAAVPEPGTCAMIAGAVGLLILRYARRRKT
ncbi:MAG: hypothetical protein JW809_17915 [Pirellulales bacterium]|nr:hypothetical protein [Pirellulales bacterium]